MGIIRNINNINDIFRGSTNVVEVYKGSTLIYSKQQFLLPSISTTALAAFSLRKLRPDYTGNAVEVRRSSDNTLINIGFDGNGDFDWASFNTFIGAGSGFVRTWYDQSTNGNNATSTTNSQQPVLNNTWTGSIPTLEWDNTDDRLAFDCTYTSFCLSMVVRHVTTPNNVRGLFTKRPSVSTSHTLIFTFSSNSNNITWDQLNATGGNRWNTGFLPNTTTDYHYVFNRPLSGNDRTFGVNTTANVTTSSNGDVSNTSTAYIGNEISSANRGLGGKIAEFVLFSSNLSSADEAILKTNTQDYYGI
jgi:hypothetical protein